MARDVRERHGVAAKQVVNGFANTLSVIVVAREVVSQADQEQLVGYTVVRAPVILFFSVRGEISSAVNHSQMEVGDLYDLLPRHCLQACGMWCRHCSQRDQPWQFGIRPGKVGTGNLIVLDSWQVLTITGGDVQLSCSPEELVAHITVTITATAVVVVTAVDIVGVLLRRIPGALCRRQTGAGKRGVDVLPEARTLCCRRCHIKCCRCGGRD